MKLALNRARKLVKQKEMKANQHENQIYVGREWNGELEGRLVILLADLDE